MTKELNDQISLINTDKKKEGPVVCLGMTFENDEVRRAYFIEKLRKKLPELKKIEGFPIGEDEDILTLSDPPYYTACPNPFIPDFIEQWEKDKKEMYGDEEEEYHREPFAADVSEGKSDPIYMAHSYHTKVPHKAIMRYILHYTRPGDIVFDGFCGTGMTGVAAQLCGDRNIVMSLGYQVKPDGTILREETDSDGNKTWEPFSMIGARWSILNDLSPAATFIAQNYNAPLDLKFFERESKRIVMKVESECGWMYETNHTNGKTGRINYIIWSDMFICPECTMEVVFWEAAVDKEEGSVKDEFPCPHCSVNLTKRGMERAWVTKYDSALKETIRQAKQVPVLINYNVGNKRYEKRPDAIDIALIEKIEEREIPYWFPTSRMMEGKETRRNDPSGYTHVHHFYTKRNLWVLASLWNSFSHLRQGRLAITSILIKTASKLHNVGLKNGRINLAGALPNALYIPATIAERNIFELINGKIEDFMRAKIGTQKSNVLGVSSLTSIEISSIENSIDYIFVDPPFGSNLNYSELSFLWEAWLEILTDNKTEAIENPSQHKGLNEYRLLMTNAFKNLYVILKPGRWMTVEFSNTSSLVWNCIQTALSDAGFVIANVAALNKGQGTFMSQTTPTAVKQDLVISAYKPSDEMKKEMLKHQNTEETTWIFVRKHLEQLPVFVGVKGSADLIVERTPRVLFDRMVAYHVQNGYSVPISSAEFQAGIAQRFPMRDGMVFLESQLAEYDKKRIFAKEFIQMSLFVADESSAIEWLRQQLLKKPQTRQDIYTGYIKEIQHISKYEKLPELDVLLEQNFLQYEGTGPVPSQIHGYLSTNFKDLRELDKEDPNLRNKAKERWYVPDPNKQADLEKLREKSLMREFASYVDEINRTKKKLKQFRLEAIRAGFKKAWGDKDYKTIVDVGSKIPENVLQEDDKLLMYYDNAQIRMDV